MERDNISIEELSFPIVSFGNENNSIYFSRKIDDLTICSSVSFNKGYYNGLTLIDSKGINAVVQNAVKVDTIGPLWGFSLLKGQKLKIHLELNKLKDITPLNELKDKIIKIFNNDEYFWNSDGELKDKIEFINKARSHHEIIDFLTKIFYKKN